MKYKIQVNIILGFPNLFWKEYLILHISSEKNMVYHTDTQNFHQIDIWNNVLEKVDYEDIFISWAVVSAHISHPQH